MMTFANRLFVSVSFPLYLGQLLMLGLSASVQFLPLSGLVLEHASKDAIPPVSLRWRLLNAHLLTTFITANNLEFVVNEFLPLL
jgi:hypothetical protein